MSSLKWYYSQFVLKMVRNFRLAHELSVEIIFQVFVVLPIRSFSHHDNYGTIYQTLGNVYEIFARPRSGSSLIITVVVVTCQLKNAGFSLPQGHFVFYYTLLVLSSVSNAGTRASISF